MKEIMEDKAINLIVIDDSFDTEEKIIRTLRNDGIAARSVRVEDEEDLTAALSRKEPDLVLYTRGMELISLRETCECLRSKLSGAPVPVIAVQRVDDESSTVEAMNDGAADLSSYVNMDHLRLVIRRELTALQNWRRMNVLQTAMSESERRCASLLDSSRDAIAYVHEGMHVYSNHSYIEMFGFALSDELEGMPILDMVSPKERDKFKVFLREYMAGDTQVENHKTHLIKSDGTEFEGEMEFSPASIDGEPCIQVIIRKEDANAEELEKQLLLLSQRDQLTGLYNRQYCLDTLESTLSLCENEDCTAVLMEIELDSFDDIKNRVGVVGADKLIVAAARALEKVTREGDVLARYMHSSYTIIAYKVDQEIAQTYASQVQDAISDLDVNIGEENINTTCSIGIAMIDKDSPETNEILARAEKAAAEADEMGGNQLKVYIPKEGELTRHEIDARIKEELTSALKNDQFILHYQPIISLHGDSDERYEVFVRMAMDDSDELVMPQDFLPAAERIGMAIAIDRWVLYRTIQVLCKRWQEGKHTRFFIKLSAPSLKDDTLIEWLQFQIKEKGLPENSILFEVKETVAVTNLKHTRKLSQQLRSINCGLVLDDFGSGANAFQLLEHIDCDYIRMGKNFMEDLTENPQHQEAIKQIASKVSGMNKLTVAQYVQDANSLSILWGMGINFIQGYFLQEPQPELNYDFTEMTG
jgi:diguanylate cyclase (GGDEF)-like protein/PAS domain S-box-containing protein